MDSKQLYIVAGHLSSVVMWDKDWIHFGTEKEIKKDLIEELIQVFLVDDSLNLVHSRKDSACYKRAEIINEIQGLLGRENFQLWNEALTKVISFNRIGVLKLGRK